MLSFEQTNELLKRAKEGDINAKSVLVSENENLIRSIVKRFIGKGECYDDLYQIACVGFLKAINNFDLSFGVRFSTYLVPMVIGEIKRYLRDDGMIKVSRVIKMQRLKINRFVEKYKDEHMGDSPTIDEVCASLDMERSDVVMALDSVKMPLSLFEKQDDEDGMELIDKIPSSDDEDKLVDKIMLRSLIDGLPVRERKILLLRFFKDKTQSETAKAVGVSQVQVSRIEAKIMEQLKKKLAD
ncbi:MAG: SigB/SigF/SigG family RNA polymerase sigma factor [Candidatus Borkfalkiaceae bacterium]|nr:SigB/SigF/SigG family RNA polymerase sigma factor [Christensenellaceae bacterium]